MNWVTIIWSMVASACLTFAALHGLVWWRQREALANLFFSLTAAATAVYAGTELWAISAETPAEFSRALWWAHLPFWVLIVSLVGFVWLYLRAGRPWLGWTACGLRTLALVLNFFLSPNINYREITALRHVRFLGESVSIPEGVPSPWMLVGQLGSLLFIIFVAVASKLRAYLKGPLKSHQLGWWFVHTQPTKGDRPHSSRNPTNAVGGLFILSLQSLP